MTKIKKARFTLYRIVKRSAAETVPERASVHTWDATFGTLSALQQDYFASFLKDVISATQQRTCSCSHCTGSVYATLHFTFRYSVNIAQDGWLADCRGSLCTGSYF